MNPIKFQSTGELKKWKTDEWKTQIDNDPDLEKLFKKLPENHQRVFYKTIILNPYVPVVPFYKQVQFILSRFKHKEGFYGGARGGGKSELFLMGASQFVTFPQWKVLILRLTYPQLTKPGAIMDRARKWFKAPYLLKERIAPEFNGETKTWHFPYGSQIMFGHVQHEKDVENYQGAEVHCVELDEAPQFSLHKITNIYGSSRKLKDDPLPLNIWMNGNPGGLSHEYFKEEFVDGNGLFVPSTFEDNIHLNQKEYKENLKRIAKNDPILYRQWRHGDWDAVPEGLMFKREWFTNNTYDRIQEKIVKRVRFWDMAATLEENPTKKGGADWTAGVLLLEGEKGKAYMEDLQMFRLDPDETEERILSQAGIDGRKVILRVEQEGGAQAKAYVHNTLARKLPGYDFEGRSSRVSKIDRAKTMLSFIKTGNLKMKEDSSWNTQFLNLICSFPTKGVHDDPVDALSGAFMTLFNIENTEPEEPDWERFIKLNR